MSDRTLLDASAVAAGLQDVPAWAVENGKLRREFVFRDFVEAMGFMMRAGIVAEKLDHHPEWFNVYKTVRVELTTHDAGGITALDFDLARAMDALAQ